MPFLRRLTFCLLLLAAAIVPAQAETTAPADLQSMAASPPPEFESMDLPDGELSAVYANRNNKPIWNFSDGENGVSTTAFLDSLEQLIAYHGLRAEDYPLELIKKLKSANDDNERNRLDLLVTGSVLRLAHDLHGDSDDLSLDYPGWTLKRTPVDIPMQLSAALINGTVNQFITELSPKNPAYTKLASALRTYNAYAAKGAWPHIDAGPSLRPHDHGPRVLQLRARLEAEDYLSPTDAPADVFDDNLEKALLTYQSRNGLDTDGHCGGKTQEALNTPLATRIEQIRANMERLRHMPDDYPSDRYAEVNIANATLTIIQDGKVSYTGPVVIGKVDRKTPFIQSKIRSMIINPIWHVPAKIAQKDILPKLRKDPHYLEKLGFSIKGNDNDPYGENIDWNRMPEREFNFRLRQAPGDQNSLGPLKFDFDNDFAVYMHGTPHQELFAKAQRNFSSGCVRLRDPEDVAEILLKDTSGDWNTGKIDAEIDKGKTRWVAIQNPMPLYILYWTVFADDSGLINFRPDVYDYDRILEDSPPPQTSQGA